MLRWNTIVLAACAALALAGCGGKRATALTICQELEAAGVATRCHDTSATACKYALERVTFYPPGGDEKTAGQVLRFANGAQLDQMMTIAKLSKKALAIESRSALTLVQIVGAVPDDAAQKVQEIVAKLPAVPEATAVDPTCEK